MSRKGLYSNVYFEKRYNDFPFHAKVSWARNDIFWWDKVGKNLVPNWSEQDVIDFMRWAYYKQEKSSTWIAKHLNEKGMTGKRGGTWKASMVLRTMRYEFHAQPELFEKPPDWGSSKWHDAVPFK